MEADVVLVSHWKKRLIRDGTRAGGSIKGIVADKRGIYSIDGNLEPVF